MSKIETGKLDFNIMEYDMPSLINDTIQLNILRTGSKPIEFKLDINDTLPLRLVGDELRIKQVLNNLLSNAIKYTEKGYVKLTIKHSLSDENNDVMLTFVIEDTGQGMKPEDKERLFTEYLRFNTDVNRNTEGTGLGLHITQNLVEMMDGKISVESEYGKGSIFTVSVQQTIKEYIPIGVELAERLCNFTFSGERQAVKRQITREPMPYGNVLVVDDVVTNLFVAEGLLKPYKLNIETATSGFAAIEKIESGKNYNVIFMDHMMPLMDGIETTKKIREMGYTGLIVALTANALAGNDEMFAKNGFDGFIPKPIDIVLLNTVLNKFIRDRNPEEAKKYKPETTMENELPEVNPKLIKVFCRDAENAIIALRKTIVNNDIKLFTTTAHAMKSALGNIGESETSSLASTLEEAGLRGDKDFILINTENFILKLETLIKTLNPPINEESDSEIIDDNLYLAEQLKIIKNACEDYDDDTAYAAFNRLNERSWKVETSEFMEKIYDTLNLKSDFDEVVKMCEEFLKGIQ
jgi:CheY-like chemotaxis protein/HPt (histidine-containing phosphotransfer) domain-containing protein/anti-sigma regulatory factor (Ser/Thr protein kinase)